MATVCKGKKPTGALSKKPSVKGDNSKAPKNKNKNTMAMGGEVARRVK